VGEDATLAVAHVGLAVTFLADQAWLTLDAIVRTLTREMALAAARLDFERAAELRKRVFALEHIQDVALIQRDDDPLGIPEALNSMAWLPDAIGPPASSAISFPNTSYTFKDT